LEKDPPRYVHGRSDRESRRLSYQASKLASLFHEGIRYPPGSSVLEAGCGVGAQTVVLARNSPGAAFTAIDASPESLDLAGKRIREEGCTNVMLREADVYNLPFDPGTFDHVFVCFLVEHLPDPLLALERLKRVIRPGGTITAIEGDHGSALFHPESPEAMAVIRSLVEIQRELGGNSRIGRQLPHLMRDAGFSQVRVFPLTVFADGEVPEDGEAVKRIFIAMVGGVRDAALARGKIDEKTWVQGIRDLHRTAEPGGSFSYTFFKATGVRPA
jgi:ubiquinone/menaquinone biosynthesis C-methylase UbiE